MDFASRLLASPSLSQSSLFLLDISPHDNFFSPIYFHSTYSRTIHNLTTILTTNSIYAEKNNCALRLLNTE